MLYLGTEVWLIPLLFKWGSWRTITATRTWFSSRVTDFVRSFRILQLCLSNYSFKFAKAVEFGYLRSGKSSARTFLKQIPNFLLSTNSFVATFSKTYSNFTTNDKLTDTKMIFLRLDKKNNQTSLTAKTIKCDRLKLKKMVISKKMLVANISRN